MKTTTLLITLLALFAGETLASKRANFGGIKCRKSQNPKSKMPIHQLPKCGQHCAKKWGDYNKEFGKFDYNTITQEEWCGDDFWNVRAVWLSQHLVPCLQKECPDGTEDAWRKWSEKVCGCKSYMHDWIPPEDWAA